MNRSIIFILSLLTASATNAQLIIQNNGTTLSAETGMLYIGNGILYVGKSDTLSVAGDIQSFANIQGTGTVVLNGTSPQHVNMNGFSIPQLLQDNMAGTSLEGDALVSKTVQFGNGMIRLNGFNLVLEADAVLKGYDKEHFFVSDGGASGQAGQLIRRDLGSAAFTFPVGSGEDRYNPFTINQNGEMHDLGVKALPAMLSEGSTGDVVDKEAVNASWEVRDVTPGKDDLGVVAGWNAGDELPGFDRAKAALSCYNGSAWIKNPAAGDEKVTGSGPFSYSNNRVMGAGVFSIVAQEVKKSSDGNISIFPNPATIGFYVDLSVTGSEIRQGALHLNLLTESGQLVRHQEVNAGTTLYYFDLGGSVHITNGEYLLQIIGNGMVVETKKILVLRQ